jgi:acetylornithine aminotransferase/acetylornithine/N-succinyldiaminopimelate aminotransferase
MTKRAAKRGAANRDVAYRGVSRATIRRDEARYLMNTYKRPAVVFTHGKGSYLYDDRGGKYLDFLGGIAVNSLGYSHPRIVKVVRREAGRAIHLSNLFHNQFQGLLARKLAAWSGLDRVFFTNSGTEAIEGALKIARAYARAQAANGSAPKTRILALTGSFHGRTFGSLTITYPAKYREPFMPLVPGADFVKFNDIADLEARFDSGVCALVMETIQGEGGIFPVSEAFWNRARELATERGAALIADEIQCGLGRTGRAFAYQKFKVLPDIVTIAKPIAAGLPLGAILANEVFSSALSPGMHGTTFGGGPLVCATALEVLKTIEDEKLMKNARERGAELVRGLKELTGRFDFVREVRGEGLMLGLDLSVEAALERGLIMNCTHDHILRFLPPLNIRSAHVKEFLSKLESVFVETPRPKSIGAESAKGAAKVATPPKWTPAESRETAMPLAAR